MRHNFCIFRETDEYKAYEHFSLTMGIFTMGETSSLGFKSNRAMFRFFSEKVLCQHLKDFPAICGSPTMIIGLYNVEVK